MKTSNKSEETVLQTALNKVIKIKIDNKTNQNLLKTIWKQLKVFQKSTIV